MYKYFVAFQYTYAIDSTAFGIKVQLSKVEDDCVVELDYKVNSEETFNKLKAWLKEWKLGVTKGHVVITNLTLLEGP